MKYKKNWDYIQVALGALVFIIVLIIGITLFKSHTKTCYVTDANGDTFKMRDIPDSLADESTHVPGVQDPATYDQTRLVYSTDSAKGVSFYNLVSKNKFNSYP